MSTLNGLLQMKEYDRVLAMVQGSLRPSNSLLTACARRLPIAVAGLLLVKCSAPGTGAKMIIVPGSQLSQLPP